MSPRSRLALALAATLLTACVPYAARAQAARDTTSAAPAARDTTRRGSGTVPADSLPSDEARAVLRDIPEPLAPDEQVEPADSLVRASERVAAPDTSAADTTGVPTPAETAPLGERPGAQRDAPADSLAGAPPGAAAPGSAPPGSATPGPAPPAPVTPGSGAPAAVPDTCWRLQLAAPTAREEAEAKRAAAESQLMVKFAIEVEQGRHKVRSRECLTRAAADALKGRAMLSGFEDAFLVRMGPDGKAIPASSAKPATTRKPRTTSKSSTTRKPASGGSR